METNKSYIGLCYRCEYRAQYLEKDIRPRMECGEPSSAVMSCYMFRPVKPVVLKPRSRDNRPICGPAAFSARMERNPDAEANIVLGATLVNKNNILLLWQLEPKLNLLKKAVKWFVRFVKNK